MSFILQVDSWTEWKDIAAFSRYADALAYGRDELPENRWRVIGDNTQILHENDPVDAFGSAATNDINRFRDLDVWVAGGRKRKTPFTPKSKVKKEPKWYDVNVYALKVAMNERRERLERYEQINWREEGF